ncbi:MAG: type 4a pilus biogenesis protein PilO [candidate division WOR-3 bacterium]
MNLLKRKVLLGGLIGIIVIIIFFIFVFYRPKIINSKKFDNEIINLRKQIKENEAMARDIENLRAQIAKLEEQTEAFMLKIAPRNEVLSIVQQMVELGKPYNLIFIEIRPPGLDTLIHIDKPDKPIQPLPFILVIQGRYLDVARYLESLRDFAYFVRCPEIEVIGKQEIRPLVEVQVLINLYGSSLVTSKL